MKQQTEPFTPLSPVEVADFQMPGQATDRKPIVPVPADVPPCTFKIPKLGGAPVRMWDYRDEAGNLLGYDARFEYVKDGVPCKDVLPVTFCEVGDKREWRSKAMPAPRSLYGLDRLAQRPSAPVVVAEGCKAADAAGELLPDYVAVSWAGGGNATAATNWASLRGRVVLIWPDRDRHTELDGTERPYDEQPGSITAINIVGKLKGIAAEIRILDLSELECSDGWDAADALQDGWTREQAADFIAKHVRPVDTDAVGLVMPHGYEYGSDGLYFVENETKRSRLCGRLKVLAKTRDVSGSGWGLLLEWRDEDGVRNLWSMPKSMLAGDGTGIRESLLDRGLFVSTDSKARGRLLQFLAAVDTPVRARAVTSVGWSGSCFVLPHQTYGDSPAERVIFQFPEAPPHQYKSVGTLAAWQERVAALAPGNSRLIFAISTAFVGPILTPATEEGGGFNMVGGSSSGKTTCMAAAASVWGPTKFMRTWRATGNGLEGIAAQHSEAFLALDELGQLDPKEAGQVAYMLANGQGRQRATKTGASRAVATWNLLYLSTGEIGLADLVRQGGRDKAAAAGQEVRILDIPADAGAGMGAFEKLSGGAETAEAFSRMIKTASAEYYGVAAEAYLRALTPIRDTVGDLVAKVVGKFISGHVPDGSDGQVLRAARRFGIVAAAGSLAIKLGVLPWQAGDAYQAAGVMFKAWLDRRGGNGSAEERNILSQVRAFFEAHADTRFDPAEPVEHVRPVLHRAGFWKDVTIPDPPGFERQYWVMPEAFKEICRGHDQAAVVAALAKVGALKTIRPDGRGSDNRRIKALDGKSVKVYAIGPEIFDADD